MWCDGAGMWFLGWTMMIAFWGGIVFLVVWAVRSTSSTRAGRQSEALDILQRRFANGEIDRDEFEARRRVLQTNRESPR